LLVGTGSVLAADLPVTMVTKAPVVTPAPRIWDIAFGAGIASDYVFRGISQSNRGASPSAYFEPRYNISPSMQLYAGIAGYGVDLPTSPSAEVDLYGGIRPTLGPLAFDFGFIYYYYPKETTLFAGTPAELSDTDFYEGYGKVTWTIDPVFSLGGNVYYSPDVLRTGADGTYASITAKANLPSLMTDAGWYVSGELGNYWLGDNDARFFGASIDLPDYTTWNVGLAFTYKVFTLDLRYYDTDLSKSDCAIFTGDPNAYPGGTSSFANPAGLQSSWCGSTFVARLSADLTLDSLK
jgi:uncharacterized protein (TIGR02001 family)